MLQYLCIEFPFSEEYNEMKKKYLECGKIINIHGIHGALKIEPWCDSPAVAAGLSKIYFEEKDGSYSEAKVKRASVAGRFVLMTLFGLETPEDAREYKGRVFYADRDDIPLKEGAFFLSDIIGLSVYDATSGKLYGRIKDADFSRHTPLYTIETERGEVLYPAISEFVKEIDIETGVKICPISGFFDEV